MSASSTSPLGAMWRPMVSCRPMKPRVGMVTIGQAPRVDVVPAMADVLGPDVEILERGALDGLGGDEIAQLAPESDDEVLVTRLTDGSSVFVGKRSVTPRVQRMIAELDALGVSMTVVLCTGHFSGLRARRPLVEPDKILLGVLARARLRSRRRRGVALPSRRSHLRRGGSPARGRSRLRRPRLHRLSTIAARRVAGRARRSGDRRQSARGPRRRRAALVLRPLAVPA